MFDFSKDDNIFNADEKLVLNRMGIGISRKEFVTQAGFSEQVTEDADCKALMHIVMAKIDGLTDEEWEDLQKYLPFDVPFDDEDSLQEEFDEQEA